MLPDPPDALYPPAPPEPPVCPTLQAPPPACPFPPDPPPVEVIVEKTELDPLFKLGGCEIEDIETLPAPIVTG